MAQIKIKSFSVEKTKQIGIIFAKNAKNGTIITLDGDLGAGKTTLTRGVAQGLNITEVVQSPTFNIMKIYLKGDRPLIHIDAYRLADFNTDIGLEEYIGYESGLTLIEWPEFIKNLLVDDHVEVNIKNLGDDIRELTITTNDENLLEALKNV